MNKIALLLGAGVLAIGVALTGCTSVESTRKFNRMGLGTPDERAICQTYVEIPGYYLWGLPIVTGSPKGDGEWSLFRFNQTAENAVMLLTREAKMRGAARVVNVSIGTSESYILLWILHKKVLFASGTGVRTKGAAMEQAAKDFDSQP